MHLIEVPRPQIDVFLAMPESEQVAVYFLFGQSEDGAELIGHAWFQAPDSDGAVHLDASEASVGDILTVEFTDSFCYELIGHVVE